MLAAAGADEGGERADLDILSESMSILVLGHSGNFFICVLFRLLFNHGFQQVFARRKTTRDPWKLEGRGVVVRSLLFLALAVLATGASDVKAQTDTIVVRPKEILDVLVNPGMGITTFQRFNGEALNPALQWSEVGPATRLPAVDPKPDFPEATIAYCRWYWGAIEPEHGKFRWDIIDLAIEEARAHGQRLAIRLMPYDEDARSPIPKWYQELGARRANNPTDKDGNIWQPDFADPLYLKYWGELVAEAGRRYDANPVLESVDISSVGYWGEGWSPYMPPYANQKALIDIWFAAFPHTELLMNFDEPEALAYGTSQGAGWRLDCLGDMRTASANKYFEPEMLDVYPQQVVRTGIQNVWQRHPVSLETCGTPASWKRDGFDVSYILDQALRWHITSLNVKSSPIPVEWKSLFEDFQRKMGYRFILRRFEYPKAPRAGSMMPIHMWWLNAGVAPIYREYQLAIELKSPATSAILRVPANLKEWLPGDAVVDRSLYVPDSLVPGKYSVRIALLDPESGKPAIQLANEGRQADGWYDMGSLQVAAQ
jgi:hypothetical protein